MYLYPILKKDMRTLLSDTELFQSGLETLERDYFDWARAQEENDLAKIIEYLKELESHVLMMEADCISFMGQIYQKNSTWQIFNRMHQALRTLSNLFNDLKNMRVDLHDSYIHPEQLKQLEIDWGRFRKMLTQIQGDLLGEEIFQDLDHVLSSGEEIKYV